MKKHSFSLLTKIALMIFLGAILVLGNEIRIGISRYIKNTLETDANATKVSLDRFSKAYGEKSSYKKVSLHSPLFMDLYKDALGVDNTKIKCLVDKNGNILDISREGIEENPVLGIFVTENKEIGNWPTSISLESLTTKELKTVEKYLYEHTDQTNTLRISLVEDSMVYNMHEGVEECIVSELIFNDETILSHDLPGKKRVIFGNINFYESYNLEIYFYNEMRDNLSSISPNGQVEGEALIFDYTNSIKGLKHNIKNNFDGFIHKGEALPSTNYADYFLLSPYVYKGKHYSTLMLRLIDWKLLNDNMSSHMNDQEILDQITVGYVLATQEYDNLIENAILQFMKDNSSTYMLTIVLIILLCIVISYGVIEPIRRVETVAKHIARKEFDYPLDIKRGDELGDLSRSIDMMRNELEKTIDSLYKEIDRVTQLEEVRKEFVSNFTHEIKTPLGIINGFSELVELEQDETKRNEYIKIIQQETKRINDLVLAMLDLSKLESKKIALKIEDIDLLDVVNESVDSLMYLVKKKNIQLELDLDNAPIRADYFKIKMVIDNFISNALRYTEENKKICIHLDDHSFSVENEGAHISDEDLQKVWYTFYKVDKARNNEGTGLGLAICKAVLEQHHFEYSVENTDLGVRFTFLF